MKCIVIDNKTNCQNQLIEYIERIPFLELVACYSTVFEAYEVLRSQNIDLLFVETDLPKVSGINFIKSMDNKPLFVFTSNNANLAIEGFNLNALDFLLKPFTFDRFFKAANKALELNTLKTNTIKKEAIENNGGSNDFILVKSDYKTIKIKLDTILYVEGLKDYIKIFTSQNSKPIITLNSLKKIQDYLPPKKFTRIHKSFIISLEHINIINKAQVIINEKYIPIGESYRNQFMSEMENLRL